MKIFPAIDLLGGKAVRLFKGDYNAVTVYSEHPEELAKAFEEAGAKQMHLVDFPDSDRNSRDCSLRPRGKPPRRGPQEDTSRERSQRKRTRFRG